MSKVDFGRLLAESRQLNAHIRSGGTDNVFLPTVQRGLEQVEVLSSTLAAQVAASEGGKREDRAALFLAARGYDAAGVAGTLRKVVHITPGATPVTTAALDGNVDAFLAGQLDEIVTGTLTRLDQLAVKEAELIIEARRQTTWDQLKGKFTESRGLDQTVPLLTKSVTGPKVAAYSKAVRTFNEERIKGSTPSLARAFENELRLVESGDSRGETLLDCWKALQFISGDKESDNVFQTVKNLSASYRAEASSAEGKSWRAHLVTGSRSFLEDSYLQFIDRTLAQYPRDALLGGRPSAIERARAFCDIKLKKMAPSELAHVEVLNGTAIWMLVFSLVRCGLLKEALSLAQSFESIIQRNDPLFFAFFKAFVTSPTNQLTGSILAQLRLEYSQRVSSGKMQDPYKMALLKIIGRCELARKTVAEVITTSEDYLWLQFWLVQDALVDESDSNGGYTLCDLQRIITDFGPRHFDPKGVNPWRYFLMLILVGLFEQGVEHLHQQGQIVDAVHFAISLTQTGLFCTSKSNEGGALFLRHQGSKKTLANFGRLLTSYATSLGQEDVLDAVNYLLLLSLDRSDSYDSTFNNSMRDLILQSGEYGVLLGDVRPDGSIVPGLLARYSRLMNLRDESTFMQAITIAAAAKCDAEGRFREALQLYNLAGRYDRVIGILCHKLSRSFIGPYNALESEELRRTAESILTYYNGHSHISSIISNGIRNTCYTLVQLIGFRRMVEEMKWAEALDNLMTIPLLPLEGDVAMISATADRVREMSDTITTLLPELLLLAMTVIVRRNEELRGFIGVDSGRIQQSELLRRMARNIMTFVGMLRLRIPQEVYSQLTRMEISLD